MNSSLNIYGPWILSIIALAQFWIWLMVRRAGGGHRIELYETGTVEVGFDSNGPFLSLAGVLRSLEREIFVQSMEVTLTSDRDKDKRTFKWIAFKPNFLLPTVGGRAWEMAHPFVITPGEPGKFNVVFHDVESFPQIKNILQVYYHHLYEIERKVLERRSLKPLETDTASHNDLISEFKRQEICVNSYTELDRKCYWDQGSYSIVLKVITEGGASDITSNFRFTVGKRDSKLLKTNCVAMLDEPISNLLGKPPAQCQTIQAEYMRSSQSR